MYQINMLHILNLNKLKVNYIAIKKEKKLQSV